MRERVAGRSGDGRGERGGRGGGTGRGKVKDNLGNYNSDNSDIHTKMWSRSTGLGFSRL